MRQSRKIQKQDIEVPPFAKSIKPGTNFFGYINANWIRHVNTPSYMSSYSISEEIQAQIEPSLEKIIQNAQTEIVNNPNKIIDKVIVASRAREAEGEFVGVLVRRQTHAVYFRGRP